MKKNSPLYAFIDPSAGGYSASRMASIFMVVVDALWTTACTFGLPPTAAYAPVSSMLGIVTGAAFGAYGANSFARSWLGGSASPTITPPAGKPVRKAKED